jgi:hypothetical protein
MFITTNTVKKVIEADVRMTLKQPVAAIVLPMTGIKYD